ncbi:MAG: Gmad2 immunoglobulin-like domain-containing protein [Patescibacteria group bacterium]
MRFLFTLFIAIIAFAAGVWYMGGFENASEVPNVPNTTTPTPAAQATYTNADKNVIRVTTPQPGATVPSTFTVSGQARGNWYFEASFPLQVVDARGSRLLITPVQAQGEWMTEEFVPFSAHITVPNYTGAATLVLHKDNPSGLPEHDASVSIPVIVQ